jgi:hypothetical protein
MRELEDTGNGVYFTNFIFLFMFLFFVTAHCNVRPKQIGQMAVTVTVNMDCHGLDSIHTYITKLVS